MGDIASTGGKVLPFPNRAGYRRATARWRRETASERRRRKRRERRNAVLGSLLAAAALTVGAWWPVAPAHAATGGFEVVRGYNLCERRPQTFTLQVTNDRGRTVRVTYHIRPVPRTDDEWQVYSAAGSYGFTLDPADCYGVDNDGNLYRP